MIKDIEVAFFSQLSYLNWNNLNNVDFKTIESYKDKKFMSFLNSDDIWNEIKINIPEPKVENGILMYNELDKRLFGVYGIETEPFINKKGNKEIRVKPLYNFDGWQFIYSADGKKIQKDYLDVDTIKETGFFAAAFMKDDDIVIAYRGSDEDIDFLGINLSIIFNKFHDQLLEAVCFYEYVKKEFGKNKTISFTGHSLGGALAQSAYLYSGKNNNTVTWNALGFGDFENKFKLDNQSFSSVLSKIYELRLPEFSPESMIQVDTNKILLEKWKNYKIEDVTEKKVYESIYSVLTKPDSNQNYRELLKKDTAMLTMLLRLSYNYSQNKIIVNNNIKNYYIKYDLVPKIKNRIGEAIVIPAEQDEKESEKTKGKDYHSVNLFLLYMNSTGMIDSNKMDCRFLNNAIKSCYIELRRKNRLHDILKQGTSDLTILDNIKNDLIRKCLRLEFSKSKPEHRQLPKSTLETTLSLFGADIKKDIKKNKNEIIIEYTTYSSEEKKIRGNVDGYFLIGQLNNVSIGNIVGGKPERIEKESKPKPKEEEPVAKAQPKEEDKYTIKEGNATVTIHHLC